MQTIINRVKNPTENKAPEYPEVMNALLRADLLISGHKEILELMAKRECLFNILHNLVTTLEEQCEGTFCTILLIDDATKTIKNSVRSKDTHDYSEDEKGVSILPPYMGPCCMAAHVGETVVADNLEVDPRWFYLWKDWSLKNNLKTCRSLPILSSAGKVLGVFAMYNKELGEASLQKNYQLELATLIAGIVIERKNLESEEIENREKLQRLNNALSNALKSRDEFLSIASHELRNPLAVMKMQNQMNLKKMKDKKEVNYDSFIKMLNSNDQQINRLLYHVETLLESSSSNILTLNNSELNLSHIINEIKERLTAQIENVECKLMLNMPESLMVFWDQHRVEQVFTNLILNSTKYAPKSTIKIFIKEELNRVSIIYSDNGPGIDLKYQNSIFDRYQRGDNESSKASGLGLGLYVVKEIINAHKGTIRLDSIPGVGSTFIIDLPQRLDEKRLLH